jgi:hypothetical protein
VVTLLILGQITLRINANTLINKFKNNNYEKFNFNFNTVIATMYGGMQ